MNREGKKCVLYPRVSTEMQVDGYSLEGQKNSLKRFADREEMEIVGIYEDAGKSGKSIEGRPAFKKMLSDIKNGLEIDYILVYKLSRFGRNAADILNSLEFVQSYGINLICIEEGIDSSQTSGKLLISVLSAVAEIERENIIEQTMNGRREKARQGGWNGGFAPYGYYLKDNQLLIEETEAEAIRIIFDKFANSDIGLGGVAKYLNLQGIKKIPRQNGTLETWSSHFIRLILDNPVYCGKIAYGRRTREKVKGTKNEYKQVHAEDYILEDGQHEGIISEELWQKVHAKRMATGIKQPSKIGKDRSHLLTGILKCPLCGSSMYTNKHAWTNKDGTYKEVYYYICGRNKQERGHHCDYKASLRKTDIEPLVIEAVKELVSDKYFAKEIEKRIGVQTDTTAIDKELANYESKLKEVDLNKARLEREIDNLPIDARFRERKIHDMTLRLDALYDTIVELEERIEDAKLRKSSIEMETITLDNIYKLMLNFGKLYDIISDEEKKSLITYLIKEIQIYPNGESEQPLKSIEFNFPIYRDGQEVRRLLWEKGNTVESEPGKGSEFVVALRFPVSGEKQEPKQIAQLEGLRALVADDDTGTCLNVSKMLQSIGMRPDWTISGKEAVIRAKDAMEQGDAFSVYMNGIEVVRQVRKIIGDATPIIILTAYDWTDIETEAKEAGVTAFCAKPLFMSELRSVLAKPFGAEDASAAAEKGPDFSGKKLLVVEDNELNLEIASTILQEAGFEVDTAENGQIALEKVENAPADRYDLILMDIQMPVMDGYEATRRIRALSDKEKASVPIVAMTANAFEDDRKNALNAGMNGHIAKPLDLPKLFRVLSELMR